MTYSNWKNGQGPTSIHGFLFSSIGSSLEDCSLLRIPDGGLWHDFPCSTAAYHYTYICQYSKYYMYSPFKHKSVLYLPNSQLFNILYLIDMLFRTYFAESISLHSHGALNVQLSAHHGYSLHWFRQISPLIKQPKSPTRRRNIFKEWKMYMKHLHM